MLSVAPAVLRSYGTIAFGIFIAALCIGLVVDNSCKSRQGERRGIATLLHEEMVDLCKHLQMITEKKEIFVKGRVIRSAIILSLGILSLILAGVR